MSYFAVTGLAGVDALMDSINTQMTGESWTPLVMAASAGQPASGQIGKEIWWTSPGQSVQPAFHSVGIARIKSPSQEYLAFQTCSALRNAAVLPISAISTTAGVTTITTTGNHNARVSDHVLISGVANPLYNASLVNAATPEVVATEDGTTGMTTTGRLTGTIAASSGGNLIIPYNYSGTRGSSDTETFIMRIDGVPGPPVFDMYGYVDELRFTAVVIFGGIFKFIHMGLTGRAQVQDDFSDVATVTGAITGTGTAQVLTISPSSPNLNVGPDGVVWLIPSDDSNGTQTVPRGAVEVLTVTDKPSATSIEIAPVGDYSAGALIGKDPQPSVICGDNSGSTSALSAYQWGGTHRINGAPLTDIDDTLGTTRANLTSADESKIDPDEGGSYQGIEIWLHQGVGSGVRYPLVGVVAWPQNTQNDQDVMVVGRDIPANRWKVFPSLEADNTTDILSIGVGPGAT